MIDLVRMTKSQLRMCKGGAQFVLRLSRRRCKVARDVLRAEENRIARANQRIVCVDKELKRRNAK